MNKYIQVSFDKSHIITLGKRMYVRSYDLLRELVNNAYDADATRVDISIYKDKIIVRDNGSGMSENGLNQYFNVGSKEKRIHSISPIFKRKRIGEMGIGKFSSLGMTDRFEIKTKQDDFAGIAVFDHNKWLDSEENDWTVPLTITDIPELEKNGTIITLYNVKKEFTPQEIADRIRSTVPLGVPNFDVFINEVKLEKKFIQGKRTIIDEDTDYGKITGTIILANNPMPFKKIGIECRVKGAMISRSLFGYEDYGHGVRRITGEVNADFLEFISSRDSFVIDSDQYTVFYNAMRKQVAEVVSEIRTQQEDKLLKQSSEALKKAANILNKTFKENPDLCPKLDVPVSNGHTEVDKMASLTTGDPVREREHTVKKRKIIGHKRGNRDEYKIRHITPVTEHRIIKRIKTDFGIRFGFINEGYSGNASYSLDDTIWVNRDHKLYKHFSKEINSEIQHLVRILISEIVMLREPADLRQAHDWGFELLSSALI